MNLDSRIKFRHLLCFIEVSRQGSLARAADVMSVSQPAISKTLKELEELLEASLFDRSKQGVTLTAAGQAFLRYAGPSVQALREGVRSLRAGEHEAGAVRLGALSTVESSLLPEVVRRLHDQHAALVVSVITGPSAYLLGQLRGGELDLVVGRMTDAPQIEGLSFEHLYSESMTLVVRPGHELLDGDRGRLGEFPVVLPQSGTTIRRHADSLFIQLGISPPPRRLETLSVALSRQYVRLSDAVWVAPLDAVREDLSTGQLQELELGLKEPGGSVGICTNPTLPASLAMQWCCEALREAAAGFRDHP
ncbi:LysR family transcriptional regulator [Stutzerimonas stutzeri]|uniref:LysR family transcriptional regulator n=1 Tax=Stutzerimonas stutzeri TaxID=316 RepID=W8RSB0_STUST|nr:pca operon transcription factor PcaQ [Stutzerimonas stutzeri]AHL74941.1 LysR family transcriptional regulator [Stutzerimonas stutzeri]MCQ4330958.1 pca operon transcription factor PcaQ [Stutzerimonas stutzeri]